LPSGFYHRPTMCRRLRVGRWALACLACAVVCFTRRRTKGLVPPPLDDGSRETEQPASVSPDIYGWTAYRAHSAISQSSGVFCSTIFCNLRQFRRENNSWFYIYTINCGKCQIIAGSLCILQKSGEIFQNLQKICRKKLQLLILGI